MSIFLQRNYTIISKKRTPLAMNKVCSTNGIRNSQTVQRIALTLTLTLKLQKKKFVDSIGVIPFCSIVSSLLPSYLSPKVARKVHWQQRAYAFIWCKLKEIHVHTTPVQMQTQVKSSPQEMENVQFLACFYLFSSNQIIQ